MSLQKISWDPVRQSAKFWSIFEMRWLLTMIRARLCSGLSMSSMCPRTYRFGVCTWAFVSKQEERLSGTVGTSKLQIVQSFQDSESSGTSKILNFLILHSSQSPLPFFWKGRGLLLCCRYRQALSDESWVKQQAVSRDRWMFRNVKSFELVILFVFCDLQSRESVLF